MVAVPQELLDELGLAEGSVVELKAVGEELVVGPDMQPPRYSLMELLDQGDPEAPLSEEERAWDELVPVGRELL